MYAGDAEKDSTRGTSATIADVVKVSVHVEWVTVKVKVREAKRAPVETEVSPVTFSDPSVQDNWIAVTSAERDQERVELSPEAMGLGEAEKLPATVTVTSWELIPAEFVA
jgi:hypothetical protein